MDVKVWTKNWCPFMLMAFVEFSKVITNILLKFAALEGLNRYVFIVYHLVFSSVLLLPFALYSYRNSELPPLNKSLVGKICLLGLMGFLYQFCAVNSVNYGSPALASAVASPLIFLQDSCLMLETQDFGNSSSLAKIIGNVVAIIGAFVAILYQGPRLIRFLGSSLTQLMLLSYSNWTKGIVYLVLQYVVLLCSRFGQARILETYPDEIIVVFVCNMCGLILSLILVLCTMTEWDAWTVRTRKGWLAIGCSALQIQPAFLKICGLPPITPAYQATFGPLSIAIAVAIGVIILQRTLYLGSIVGSLVIVTGTTAVIWGKGKEEVVEEGQIDEASSSPNAPFLGPGDEDAPASSRPGDEDAPESSSSNVPFFGSGDEDADVSFSRPEDEETPASSSSKVPVLIPGEEDVQE